MSETYFITGATGLVGSSLVEYLANQGEEVVTYVRDAAKADQLFSSLSRVSIVAGALEDPISYLPDVDYIIHAAAPTGSRFFIEQPVETIDSIVQGTKAVLEFARQKNVKSMTYLSSMEVYGTPTNDEDLTEDQQFYLDPLSIRSNYPLGKRLAENMCVAYGSEYAVPVKIARLAQVLGKKLLADDNRVIAQFIRAAKSGADIELATDGKTKQTYIGMDDVMRGILTILRSGDTGSAYNLANEDTYCSIHELAQLVAQELSNGISQVKINASVDTAKYPPNRTLRVNSDKLRALGWQPHISLASALKTLAES